MKKDGVSIGRRNTKTKKMRSKIVIFIICLTSVLSIKAQAVNDSLEVVKCKEKLAEQNLMLYTLKEIIKKNNSEILLLKAENAKLIDKIANHNDKLKPSQDKYRIE